MTDSPIDFTSLDAGGDGARREALARRIELAAAAEPGGGAAPAA